MRSEYVSTFVGKTLHSFDVLPSTQSYAQELLAKSKPDEGTAIISRAQTHGKGQIGRHWHSLPGKNLLLSVIFYPEFISADKVFLLSMTCSLALHDCVSNYISKDLFLKWPNDLFWTDKKLGGMLIQNGIRGKRVEYSIWGIGLNVNQPDFPNDIPGPASILGITGAELDLGKLRDQLFASLENYYIRLKERGAREINESYHELLLYKGKWMKYYIPGQGVSPGMIEGVNAQGQLILRTTEGLKNFNFREIEFTHEIYPDIHR